MRVAVVLVPSHSKRTLAKTKGKAIQKDKLIISMKIRELLTPDMVVYKMKAL